MKEKTTFNLVFNKDWALIGTELNNGQLRIVSKPKKKYTEWYWRILEFFTFGQRFNACWEYTVEPVKQSFGLGSGILNFGN